MGQPASLTKRHVVTRLDLLYIFQMAAMQYSLFLQHHYFIQEETEYSKLLVSDGRPLQCFFISPMFLSKNNRMHTCNSGREMNHQGLFQGWSLSDYRMTPLITTQCTSLAKRGRGVCATLPRQNRLPKEANNEEIFLLK